MERYDYQYGSYGTHTVKVTLQHEKYKGYLVYEVGGNTAGASVLNDVADTVSWVDNFKENDFGFEVVGEDWFRIALTDSLGNEIIIEDELDDLENYIVAVAIVGYEEDAE